jgi:hypothetical protein
VIQKRGAAAVKGFDGARGSKRVPGKGRIENKLTKGDRIPVVKMQ